MLCRARARIGDAFYLRHGAELLADHLAVDTVEDLPCFPAGVGDTQAEPGQLGVPILDTPCCRRL
jgi:hypothetical protein